MPTYVLSVSDTVNVDICVCVCVCVLPSHWQVAFLRCRGDTKLRRAVLYVDTAVLSSETTSSQKLRGQSRPAHSFCTTRTMRTPVISSMTAAEEFSLWKTT